ncbi:MAG TPA: TIGR02206 family membrane protein [Spirochaetota bacterium]|nr:TIGR02206 family membrane protein [Spirochaetota bacterium]
MELLCGHGSPFGPFRTFSGIHLVALGVLFAAGAVFLFSGTRCRSISCRRNFRLSMACFLIALEIAEYSWKAAAGEWSLQNGLPLHLCRIGVYVTAAMLITGNRYLFELSYFWSLGGALNALITPTLSGSNFPHLLFFKFFISHGLLILAALYMMLIERQRPYRSSVVRVIGVTHLYAGTIAVINSLLGSNYLYLCGNPGRGTVISSFGPWPEYLPFLWGMVMLGIVLLYLPFELYDMYCIRRKSGS